MIVRGAPASRAATSCWSSSATSRCSSRSGTAHRIENLGDEPVEFVEVQVGDRLDESDIVRLEDRYGRL